MGGEYSSSLKEMVYYPRNIDSWEGWSTLSLHWKKSPLSPSRPLGSLPRLQPSLWCWDFLLVGWSLLCLSKYIFILVSCALIQNPNISPHLAVASPFIIFNNCIILSFNNFITLSFNNFIILSFKDFIILSVDSRQTILKGAHLKCYNLIIIV